MRGVVIAWWKVSEENFHSRGFIYKIYKTFPPQKFLHIRYYSIISDYFRCEATTLLTYTLIKQSDYLLDAPGDELPSDGLLVDYKMQRNIIIYLNI